ncbi:aldose 1-epimerase family protein [Paeniglutamicibacter sp. ABSL32-1]|uniref:aldose 1-epimerase family protein n=1 Tax=Paeniglutamicibacter quisquiliarum TaxID=2849498 RepID=UPI001C2DA56C|nr:aldose 1-epimerase family protein [Paeniglutamicibacter quisquiliarum]MBV1778194.1 aldose 1-epimerase family protein [Paeniglutamicibacter quisquiliarum]
MGERFVLAGTIAGRSQHAVVNQVGASLRRLVIDGVELVHDYPGNIAAPSAAGVVLVPWPNRVAGGTWTYEGAEERLAVTEPARGNAIHGLLRHSSYREVGRTEGSVVLAADISAAPGYPFELATSVRYELVADGLRVTHRLENLGDRKAPVAVGAHPYLRVGDTPAADLKLLVNAERHLEVDGSMIPTGGQDPVAGTRYDYRQGRPLNDVALDDTWSELSRDPDGNTRHSLEAPDGSRVELHMDANYGFIQVFTAPAFPGPSGPVRAVAMEPMTAPANAFNNGLGLRWLAPGEVWESSWGIRHVTAAGPR